MEFVYIALQTPNTDVQEYKDVGLMDVPSVHPKPFFLTLYTVQEEVSSMERYPVAFQTLHNEGCRREL